MTPGPTGPAAATPDTDGRGTAARVGLAVNPTAGGGRGAAAGERAARVLRGAGLDVVPLASPTLDGLLSRARTALAAGRGGNPEGRLDALAVVGGDGMVHAGVNLVAGSGVPLGVVAAGTGNDIARALDLPVDDPAGAAEVLAAVLRSGTTRSVDAARIDGPDGPRWFAGVLGAGFDAIVNERANSWSWPRGRARYNLAIARELPVFRPREYEITLDGVPWHTAAMLVAVANGPSYGGGMRVAPDARLDDGLLDVLVVGPISRREFVRIFPRVYAGTHVEHPAVTIRRAAVVEVAARGIVAYADGERVGRLPLRCVSVPAALDLLAPPPAG